MERSEPTLLIPQWLKGSGNVTGGGITGHQTSLSSWLFDDHSSSKHTRNRSANVNSHDIGRSIADRTTSTYFRQSSFGRGRGDNREWERDTCDYSDTFENILQNRVDKDLRRAQSLITGKCKNNKSNQNNSNGLTAGSNLISTIHKTAFERDFPSLGADEKKTNLKVGRVSSPVGHSIIIGGDGWTSALAEAPTIFGSLGPGGVVQQPITSTTASMAATVAQRPSCANNISQLSVGNQRLEELVLKQSRQLIPIQTLSKSSVLMNPLEKSKAKISQPQQNSSSFTNLSPRGGAGKPDSARTSIMVGKFKVLKPSVREKNGAPLISKDSCSSPADDSVIPSTSAAVTPDRRQTPPILEKRLTQAQSRNNFFNLVRKNSMSSPSTSVVTGSSSSSSVVKQSGGDSVVDESTMKAANNCENGCILESDNNNNLKANRLKTDTILYSEEKEAAFLRSLGWEENNNNGDDEGLTEEEISSFYKDMNEYIKLRPSCKTSQKIHPKFFGPHNLSMGSKEGATFSGSKASC